MTYQPVIDLSSFTAADGFRIDGATAGSSSGWSVSGAGDVNGDGFADLIVGAYQADPFGRTNAGSSYVIFGKASGFGAVDLAALSASQGFRIDGAAAFEWSGYSISDAGDYNGDGFADVIVGANQASPLGRTDAGSSYVLFGQASGFANVDLAAGLAASQGFRIDGAAANDRSGFSVSGAGDVNGDGFADLIVGASLADPSGRGSAGSSYVLFGKASGFANVDLASLAPGAGFRIDGAAASDTLGRSVSGAGDVNGDGFADLIVGANLTDPSGRISAGSSYVLFGQASGFANIDLASLAPGAGFRIDGAAEFNFLGHSVSGAGDINGDGFADLIVGAYGADALGRINAGSSYVLFGKTSGFSNIDLASLASSQGFRIDGAASDWSGFSVSGAGDVNGDGFADLIVGAYGADALGRSNAGSSYVLFGKATGFANIDLSSNLAPSQGFRIDGAVAFDESGRSVSGAGDVNGDGLADLVVGAYQADPLGRIDAGSSYVVFGQSSASITRSGGADADRLRGYEFDDNLSGLGGADLITGQAGNDTLSGGDDTDFIMGGAGADSMDGGAGFDGVSWQDATAAVTINLTNQALNAGQAAGDQAFNFEGFFLSAFGDSFTNGPAGGYVFGFGGNDTIIGGSGSEFIDGGLGADSIDGGGGFDYLSYANATAGIRLDFSNPASNTGEAAGDVIASVEAFFLSGFADVFIGQSGQNIVFGEGGADSITGGANSSDWLFGGAGDDTLTGGVLDDLLSGGADADTYVFLSAAGNGFDQVMDFTSGLDRIQLTGSGFSLTPGGLVNGFNFISGAAPAASGARPTLLYDTGTGILTFDLDGTGGTFASSPLAHFTGAPALAASDFVVI